MAEPDDPPQAASTAPAPAAPCSPPAAGRRARHPEPKPTTNRVAGQRPFPGRPAGTDMLPKIKHIVVLMMENHSFDNYFGMLGRGDGSTRRRRQAHQRQSGVNGEPVVAFPAPTVCQATVDISQDWVVSHTSWNHGHNNGFVKAKGRTDPMAYFTETDLPFYYSLGRTFPLCDRWFCSVMAQTDPNRRFLMAGSAFGLVDDSFPPSALHSYRPDRFGTVFEMLDHYGISWRNYYSSVPSPLLFLYLSSMIGGNLKKIDQFYTDAASGSLPGFCIVDPDFDLSSEENPQDIQNGEPFAAKSSTPSCTGRPGPRPCSSGSTTSTGATTTTSPPARRAPDDILPAVPPRLDGDLYGWTGFRVPAVIVSPWARRDYVSPRSTTTPRSSSSSRRSGTCRRCPTATPTPPTSSTRSTSPGHRRS